MDNVEEELKRISENIISGSIEDIKYLTSLDNEPMMQHDYVYIMVRAIFLEKLKEKIERRKKNNCLIFTGAFCSLLFLYYLYKK